MIWALELYLSRTIRLVDEKLNQIETQLSAYQDFSKYLKRKERVNISEKVNSVSNLLQFLGKWRSLYTTHQQTLLYRYKKRIEEFDLFLKTCVSKYVQQQVEKNKEFFSTKHFDNEQLEAIIIQEDRHLVVAAAGSGKTRTLTARIAFNVHCGANPENILALAYTNQAEDEMRERLNKEYGIQMANVRTFHSIGREFARSSPNYRPDIAEGKKSEDLILEAVKILSNERDFAELYLHFATEFRDEENKQNNIEQNEKLYRYVQNQKYLALNWQRVKSIGERDIANFLFLHKVKFEYEAPAKWADKSEGYRPYKPDFYLPLYDIWIEHWAINRHGEVPDGFSSDLSGSASQKYIEGMEWKREQFKKHNHKLIETYSYQYFEKNLIIELKKQLIRNRVELQEMTAKEIMAKVKKLVPNSSTILVLMVSFINKAKTNGLNTADISSKLSSSPWSHEQEAFALMMIKVWQQYESLLKTNEMIDFNDMINLALEEVQKQNGQQSRYGHILVDEFQDITDPQLELLKCLLQNNDNSMLFCVGDGRQNIFSFAGSNMYNILEFNKKFRYAEETNLSTNYRCPKNIVEVSNHIARLNKVTVESPVIPALQKTYPISVIEMPIESREDYKDWEFRKSKELLTQLITARKIDEQILVLARYNFQMEQLMLEFPNHETTGIKFLSVHKAKGTEADYVLLLGCVNGKYGFPTEIKDFEVLDIVKQNYDETSKLEEERRLFYVAVTRCKKELFLFTSKKSKSQFVSEIEPYLSEYQVAINTKLR